MNSPSKQRMLKEKISKIKANIFLLQETKCDKEMMERVTQKIWPGSEAHWIAAEGYSRGLVTLWDPDLIEMQHFSSSARHLILKFRCIGTEEEGYITNVYGPNVPHLKRNFMDELNLIGDSMRNKVWVLGGAFNMITTPLDKKGNIHKLYQESKDFGDLIENLGLVDVPTRNCTFTWNNIRGKEHKISVRLDKFLL